MSLLPVLAMAPASSLLFVVLAASVGYVGRRAVAELIDDAMDFLVDLRFGVRRGRPDDSWPRRVGRADDEQRHLELLVVSGVYAPDDLLDHRCAPREAARTPTVTTRRAA